MERTEREKIRQRNCKGEYIYRSQSDFFFPIAPPQLALRASYPWETEGNLPRITKDFFRCKGSSLNPFMIDKGDCEGGSQHGLSVLKGKEGVYPILLNLLNYLQKKTEKKVVITCGHRCATHNAYADPSQENRFSKHQRGAEVDFYVHGSEGKAEEVPSLLMQSYQETACYQGQKD